MKGVYKGFGAASIIVAGIFTSAYADSSKDIIAVGPVDLVEAGSITVLGREYKMQDTSGLVEGQKVAVHGALQPDGSATSAWAESLGTYTPGSDPIFETGIVTKVDMNAGHLSIGDSDVDYTATLASSDSAVPTVGQLVSVEGIQPALGGVILGSTTSAGVTGMSVALVHGTTGTNVASITGSAGGTSSVTGSAGGTSSITGSAGGGASITGSAGGTSSITGSAGGGASITGSASGTG